jgi:arylsulfatase A-like enzyme
MRAALLGLTALVLFVGLLARSLLRPAPPPSEPVVRLVDHLSAARRVVQKAALLQPEERLLQPGSVAAPVGFHAAPPDEGLHRAVVRLIADTPRPLALELVVPVIGGRDQVVRAILHDPGGKARLLVEHAPTPEQDHAGWHRASETRGDGGRVLFDWREDVPPGRDHLRLRIEADAISELTLERVAVREAGARDPSLVTAGAASPLVGLVDRPLDGVRGVGPRGVRRLERALLASAGGIYEWALDAPPPARFAVETALVPRGPAGAPVTMRVEVETAAGWQTAATHVRGAPNDAGGWRPLAIELPRDARALRIATEATGAAPALVAWGNPRLLAAAPRRPNVLIVTLDAVRPDHLQAYGHPRANSPFLAALAQKGVRFSDVVAQRGHTWASTTSLVSGLLPETSGVVSRGARPHRGTRGMADRFARAGYFTARVGSPDLPRGQLSGFDVAELADFDVDILQRVLALFAEAGGRPLFLWVHLANAHYPWRVADAFNRFDPGYRGPFVSGLGRDEFRAVQNQRGGVPDEAERQHFAALYDGAILQMDTRLGQVMRTLDDQGFFSDAVIAVTADHGTHLGEHDVWFLHSTPWGASLRVPLLLVAPGRLPAGQVVPPERGRALLVDLSPTLLELAGLPAEGGDGISLVAAARGGRIPDRTTVTHFLPAGYVLVENERYKLLHNPGGEPLGWPGELTVTRPLPLLGLYDRRRDPDETHDLAPAEPLITGLLEAAALREAGGAAPRIGTEARQLLIQAGYADDD